LATAAPADTAAPPADVVALAPDPAGLSAVSVAVSVVGVPTGAAELPVDVVVPMVAASPSDPAAVLAIGIPATTGHPASDATALAAPSTAVLAIGVPAGAAELPADHATPEAAASAPVLSAGVTAAPADPAPDVSALFAGSVAVPAATPHSAGSVANHMDTAPRATHAKTTSFDDPDASLLTLLRRLQSWRSRTLEE
jgi:hypothetical protein